MVRPWKPVALQVDVRNFFSPGNLVYEALGAVGLYAVSGFVGVVIDKPWLFLLAVGPSLVVIAALLFILWRNHRRLHPSAASRLQHDYVQCDRVSMISRTKDPSLDLITRCHGCGAVVIQKQRHREREPGLPNWIAMHAGSAHSPLEREKETIFEEILLTTYCFDKDKERLYKCRISTVDGKEIVTKDTTKEGSGIFDHQTRINRIERVDRWDLMYPMDFSDNPDELKAPQDGLFFVDWYALGVADRLVKRDLFELKGGRLVR